MRKAIKLSAVAALLGCSMAQAASVDINGYRGGTLDFMLKGIYVIDDEKNGWAPSNGGGYLVKLKYETPDTLMDGLRVGAGAYINGDGGLTNWDKGTAPEFDKAAGGLVVDTDGKSSISYAKLL
ncbi:MAG: hypothetical protein QG559_467 [Campylobacterota bacterium]|nr:hypothetical protein [Campylobacterota bacterium]